MWVGQFHLNARFLNLGTVVFWVGYFSIVGAVC